jgi:hypothetical protein
VKEGKMRGQKQKWSWRVAFVGVVAVLGCEGEETISMTQYAQHQWEGHHWPSSNLALSVWDNTRNPTWAPFIADVAGDWNVLGTPISLATDGQRGSHIIVEERYSPFWLGLAEISLRNGHIVAGRVLLNRILLTDPAFGPVAARHVLCQEKGHVLGLDHIRGDTCMDDCSWASTRAEWLACLNDPASAGPNAHDAEELNNLYDHIDSPPESSGPAGPDCTQNPTHPRCRNGEWITIHVFSKPF